MKVSSETPVICVLVGAVSITRTIEQCKGESVETILGERLTAPQTCFAALLVNQ